MSTATATEQVHCPSCGRPIFVTPGTRVDCPGCAQPIAVEHHPVAVAPPRIAPVIMEPPPLAAQRGIVRRRPGVPVMFWILLASLGAFALLASLAMAPVHPSLHPISNAAVLAVAGSLYLVPALNAYLVRHRSSAGILVMNIAFGWTVIGWIVVLIWSGASCRSQANDGR